MPFRGRDTGLDVLDGFAIRHQDAGGPRIECHRHPFRFWNRDADNRRDIGTAQHAGEILNFRPVARAVFGIDDGVVKRAARQYLFEPGRGHLRQHTAKDVTAGLQGPAQFTCVH